jgi:adenylate kinase
MNASRSTKPLYIVLMGMQGAGKGTQAEELTLWLGIPHVTSGGMFRAIMASGSALGQQIKAIYDKGHLIPDDLTIEMIKGRLMQPDAKEGVILDGFPRTVPQAEALTLLLESMGAQVAVVPYFVISEEQALIRLGGRRVCTHNDNHIYHIIYDPPKTEGVCDIDGAPLKIRKDDQPEAIKERIQAFKRDTAPVLDYYDKLGLLREINGEQPIDHVTALVKSEIEKVRGS